MRSSAILKHEIEALKANPKVDAIEYIYMKTGESWVEEKAEWTH